MDKLIQEIIVEELKNILVYGTLKNPNTAKKALGFKPVEHPINIPNKEVDDYNTYPNLEKGKKTVHGDELKLSNKDVKKLDNWEEKYKRKSIELPNKDKADYYSLKKTT